jgi:hypothetical protein
MAGAFEPEVAQVTSNTLQAEIRSLLPSVSGFGSRLGAQNVIVPVIDLTQVAGGSALAENLQTAWDFTTGLTELVGAGSSTIISTPGFWQIDVTCSLLSDANRATIALTDGVTSPEIWQFSSVASGSGTSPAGEVADGKFVAYIKTGVTCVATLTGISSKLNIWYRQIADSNGVLVNPDGFTSL